jgi:hypothetical protein
MLSFLRLIALAPIVVVLAAMDAPPIIERAFGNTIVSTYPDNRTAKLWLQPGGVYAAEGRRGDRTSGHWKVDGERLCLKQDHPATLPFFRYCTPIPSQDHWTAKAVTGETIQVRLVEGQDELPAKTAKRPSESTGG